MSPVPRSPNPAWFLEVLVDILEAFGHAMRARSSRRSADGSPPDPPAVAWDMSASALLLGLASLLRTQRKYRSHDDPEKLVQMDLDLEDLARAGARDLGLRLSVQLPTTDGV